jgi:hypothetical protein
VPIPHRKASKPEDDGVAAFLEVIWLEPARMFYGALLLIDSRGCPLEFVYNSSAAPAGFLWPPAQVRGIAVPALAHSLFAACRREPDLLVASTNVGDPPFCRTELAPSIPFAQVEEEGPETPEQWTWLNSPPTPAMRAHTLALILQQRGLTSEPLQRARAGLREAFPHAAW